MAGYARREVVREGEIGIYHTWSRCVQRAFLCGQDPLTGHNYDYRREWIERLLEYQAGVFAVDVGNFAILQNHEHLIARTRPDIAACWSDEQVAWRWRLAWPEWKGDRWSREPTDEQIKELLADPEKLDKARSGLSSLSWFMARWKEPIARLANKEMQTCGHFFEQRFGCRELVGEGAVLTCSIYIDVNQVKAGEAASLEQSNYTGIQERIQAWRVEQAEASVEKFHRMKGQGYELETGHVEQLLAACWLAPIIADGPLLLPADKPLDPPATRVVIEETEPAETTAGSDDASKSADTANPLDEIHLEYSSAAPNAEPTPRQAPISAEPPKKVCSPSRKVHEQLKQTQRRRASDQAFLSMPFEQYLEMAQWAAEQTLATQDRSATQNLPPPPQLASRLRESQLDPDRWYSAVDQFKDWFHRLVGSAPNLAGILARSGRRWCHGIRHCRDVFT